MRTLRSMLIAATLLAIPATSLFAGIFISVGIAPPALPVYTQPLCPGPNYIWTPGYWAYGSGGYFWVPGTWVVAPFVGGLWTPGYWGWGGSSYGWHSGYWGTHVGFYGGVNYGYGYGGRGYEGGYWRGGAFSYNRTVNNVNVTNIHNTYEKTVINNTTVNRVSYNGGHGGIAVQPNATERSFAGEHHVEATSEQVHHAEAAGSNRALLASVNHGNPSIAATPRPGAFARGVVPANRPASAGNSNPAVDRPPTARPNLAGSQARAAGGGNGQYRAPAAHNTPADRPQFHGNEAAHGNAAQRAPQPAPRANQAPHESHQNAAPHPSDGGHPAPHGGAEHHR